MIFNLASFKGNPIYFNNIIGDLDSQAGIAATCIENYVKIKSFERLVNVSELIRKDTPKSREKLYDEDDELDNSQLKYQKGTKIFDVFPFKEGETKEDLLKSFKRIAIYI